MKYCLINDNGEVINTILWDGKTRLDLPDGHSLLPESECEELPRYSPPTSPPDSTDTIPPVILRALVAAGLDPAKLAAAKADPEIAAKESALNEALSSVEGKQAVKGDAKG